MSVVDLINYLRLKGPHDLESIPTASEEDAPPPGDELTDEEGDLEGVKDNPVKIDPRVEVDPMGDLSVEEPMKEEDPEKDPEEDPSEGEPMEKENPREDPKRDSEENSEVSEGQLMGSEDLVEDREEERRNRTIQDEQTRGSKDLEEKINSLWNRAECEIEVTRWKWGRCGRMCKGTCPLDAPNQ